MKPLVSIIVPIYNVEKYLEKCIDSILNQTLENIEVILIDDGSTDNCRAIIDEYKKKDERVISIYKENGGQSSARNMGLDIAKGDYIGFVDSDDWIDTDMFENLYKDIEKNNADIAVCSRRIFSENNHLEYELKVKEEIINLNKYGVNSYIVEKLLNTHTLGTCNKMYRKGIIIRDKVKFDSVKSVGSEDTLFNYKVLQHSTKIVGISDTYYNSLARNGSTARSYDKEYMIKINNLLQRIEQYYLDMSKTKDNNSITPIMLIYFLNRNISRISNYSNENIVINVACQLKQSMSEEAIKTNMYRILSDKSYISYIKKMGYTSRGILYIKIFSLLCSMKMYKLASRFITLNIN